MNYETLQVRVSLGICEKAKVIASLKGMTKRQYFDELIDREYKRHNLPDLVLSKESHPLPVPTSA